MSMIARLKIVHVNQRQKRIEEAKQNRSDAINRTLQDAEETIAELKAELFATRLAAGIAVVVMASTLIRNALEGLV